MRPFVTAATPITHGEAAERAPLSTRLPRILFVGDSISCGLVDSIEGQPPLMPLGCLQAFPYATKKRLLSSPASSLPAFDLVAYPSWHFVEATPDEESRQLVPAGGMEKLFWRVRKRPAGG